MRSWVLMLLCFSLSAQAQESEVVPAAELRVSAAQTPSRAAEPLHGKLVAVLREIIANIFRVRFSEVIGNYRRPDSYYLDGAAAGPWLWQALAPDFLAQRFGNPWIEHVALHWSIYPLRVVVEIKEAEPWLVAEFDYGTWLVARSGELLEPLPGIHEGDLIVEVSTLPRLDGMRSTAQFQEAVAELRNLELAGGLPFSFERATVRGSEGLLLTPASAEHPELLVSAGSFAEAEGLLRRLRAVLDDLARRGEHPSRLDLRFKNRVVIPPPG